MACTREEAAAYTNPAVPLTIVFMRRHMHCRPMKCEQQQPIKSHPDEKQTPSMDREEVRVEYSPRSKPRAVSGFELVDLADSGRFSSSPRGSRFTYLAL